MSAADLRQNAAQHPYGFFVHLHASGQQSADGSSLAAAAAGKISRAVRTTISWPSANCWIISSALGVLSASGADFFGFNENSSESRKGSTAAARQSSGGGAEAQAPHCHHADQRAGGEKREGKPPADHVDEDRHQVDGDQG